MTAYAGYSGGGLECTEGKADVDDVEPAPNYEELYDYTEAIYVEYDPSIISYQQLVNEWTKIHSPTEEQSLNTRYKSAIWYLNAEQQSIANDVIETWKRNIMEKKDKSLYTNALPATKFFMAEDYHQDYYLRTGQARWIQ